MTSPCAGCITEFREPTQASLLCVASMNGCAKVPESTRPAPVAQRLTPMAFIMLVGRTASHLQHGSQASHTQ